MDVKRLAKLVDMHAAALELFAARWTASPEDCVQEAFVRLAAEPTEPRQVVGWLYRVVRNLALNAARSERRRRQREQQFSRLRPAVFENPSESLDAAQVSDVLSRLPPQVSEIIVLRIWSQLSFEEIAELLQCSASSAHRRYRRALAEVRKHLETCSCHENKETMKRSCRQN